MDTMIYDPLEEYKSKFRDLHIENARKRLSALVKQSGVDIEANRATIKEHETRSDELKKLQKRCTLWRVLRVLACITLLLIPLVIFKITPKIRKFREQIELLNNELADLLDLATSQMQPLNALFTNDDALRLIEETIPMLDFAPFFSAQQESDMIENYDFEYDSNIDNTTIASLAGHYNENPFVFQKIMTHTLGVETYHGYKTIFWTESYTDSDGKRKTRTRSQTLHASVTKPKPYYTTHVTLSYCAQGGPELCFFRDAEHHEQKSEREVERYIRKGEKRLKRLTDEAIEENRDFTSMSNTDFEVLFDALDRTDEVQFRTLFTPLAQTNLVDIMLSDDAYGDDFNFHKRKRTNVITTQHSQQRPVRLAAAYYRSHSYDEIEERFIGGNAEFFKSIYFDFAPLWAIPIYQDRPVHSLDPISDYERRFSGCEYETLANKIAPELVNHPSTQTEAILKARFVQRDGGREVIDVSAYSYDMISRVDLIPVYGNDGRWHDVAVAWQEYIPLVATNRFFVALADGVKDREPLAQNGELCIFDSRI